MRTLVLYSSYLGTRRASYYSDWLDAFLRCPSFQVTPRNIVPPQLKVPNPSKFRTPPDLDLERRTTLYSLLYQTYALAYRPFLKFWIAQRIQWDFKEIMDYDLIVLLHSTNADSMLPLNLMKPFLERRRGRVVMFVGNEYVLMPEKLRFINDVDVDFIASQLPSEAAQWLYGECRRSSLLLIPHGLNSRLYKVLKDPSQREIDLGFIGDRYSLSIGDNERTALLEFFARNDLGKGLRKDIRLGAKLRIPRTQYIRFLNSIRGTVGAESGTYYLEKTDKTLKQVEAFLSRRPATSFHEVYERFFIHYPNPIHGKAISSRHFEPVGTKTCQILLEGHYNGILFPDVHYIRVKRDFSNIREVMERFSDRSFVDHMADETLAYVMDNHTYDHRVRDLWRAVSAPS